jgi:hypothetical protein
MFPFFMFNSLGFKPQAIEECMGLLIINELTRSHNKQRNSLMFPFFMFNSLGFKPQAIEK